MADLFESRSARPMLIGKTAEPFDDTDSLFELKLDGERCLAYLDKNEAQLVNRRGYTILQKLPELWEMHRQVSARCILDGEIITGLGSKEDFDNIKNRIAHQSRVKIELGARQYPAIFVAFDILYHESRDVTSLPLTERKALLEGTVTESASFAVARSIEAQGKAFYDIVIAQGLEGVIGKKKQSLYTPGKRTKEWVKVKNVQEDDYVICGYIPAEFVAMLILGQYNEAGQMVYKGRTTLGLRREDFAEIQKVARASSWPFAASPPEAEDERVIWLKPAMVCTVYFIRKLEGGLMRQPHYRTLRPDKAPEEVLEPPADAK